MRILVAYATAAGSTAGIAEEIGRVLVTAGVDREVVAVGDVTTVDGFDAVVIGSAVHSQTWLPEADRFVERFAGAIGDRPVWLFSVSSVGETTSVFRPRIARAMLRRRPEPGGVARAVEMLRVRGHRNFAGVVERGMWGRTGDVFVRLLGGSYGDHRDWRDIDAWADSIAASLTPARLS